MYKLIVTNNIFANTTLKNYDNYSKSLDLTSSIRSIYTLIIILQLLELIIIVISSLFYLLDLNSNDLAITAP